MPVNTSWPSTKLSKSTEEASTWISCVIKFLLHFKCSQTSKNVRVLIGRIFRLMSQLVLFSRLLLPWRPLRGSQHRFCSSSSCGGEARLRRENLFFEPQMQQLLLRLQGRDHTKVAKASSTCMMLAC